MIVPEISIIIPLYNKSIHIARALNSVLNQTFYNFEVIVVDDGSTDGGTKIVMDFNDPRIRLIQQKNQGASIARNVGVQYAKANLIAFLDADDEWTQNYIEIILKLRKRYPQAGMYTTAYQISTHDGKLTWPKYKYIPFRSWEGLLPNFFKSLAFGDSPVRTSLLSVPKSIFIELGGFPPGYRWAHDVDLFGKIALKYPVAFSWKLGGIYHGDAVNRLSDLKRPIDYDEPFIETARNAIINGEVRPDFIGPLNEFIFRQETPRVARYILSGNSETARNILSQCKPKQYYYYSMKILLLLLSIIPYPVIRYSTNIKFLKIALMELFHISPEAKYSQGLYR